MNTDNTAISGETLDYGPCAFLDEYDPRQEVQLDRSRGPLRVREPAAHRAVEHGPARRGAPRPAVRRRGGGDPRSRRSDWQRFPARFEAAHLRVLRAKLGLVATPTRPDDRALAARSARAARREPRRLHVVLPSAVRVRGRSVGRRGRPVAVRPAGRLPRLGRDVAPATGQPRPLAPAAARVVDATRQPSLHPAQPSRRRGHRGRRSPQRLHALRGARRRAGQGPTTTSQSTRTSRIRPVPNSGTYRTFCGT